VQHVLILPSPSVRLYGTNPDPLDGLLLYFRIDNFMSLPIHYDFHLDLAAINGHTSPKNAAG
jgi:hypothetical protein